MTFLFSLALRNLTRNVKRSLLTSVAAIAGVALMVLGFGMVDGLDENVIRTGIDTQSGHVLLRPGSYDAEALNHPIDGLEPVPVGITAQLDAAGVAYTERLRFDVKLIRGADGLRATGLAVDPERDAKVFPRDKWTIDGALPEGREVLVGARLGRILGVAVGDEVILQARTSMGAQNALSVVVSGLVTTRSPAVDNNAVLMSRALANELVRPLGPSEIAVRLDHRDDAFAFAPTLHGFSGWGASTWRDESADILALNDIRRKAIQLMVFMLMAIAATGIANTLIMAAYERVREVGALMAMGMSPRQVQAMFVLEGAALGLAASLMGVLVGGGYNYYLSTVGIDFSKAANVEASGFAFDTMFYTNFTVGPLLGGLVFGSMVAILASFIPASTASKLNPADAVRAD
jgi:putative ABC transport system permease protein